MKEKGILVYEDLKTNLTTDEIKRRLDSLCSNKPSQIIERMKWKEENKEMIDKNVELLLMLLEYKDNNNLNIREFMDNINIPISNYSLLMKGEIDLTVSQILNIEKILDKKLLNF